MAREVPGREEESAKAVKTRMEAARISKSMKRACRRSQRVRISRSIRAGVLPVPAGAKGAGYLSPRVKARMAELQLTQADLAAIQGSGNAGRVTIKDLESFLGGLEKQTAEDASAIRTGVADAMRRSWTRPLATVGVSVCLDPVLEDRKKRDPKPGPALYVLRALALALAETPAAASRLIGGRAFRSESIDIGVAVEAQDGIMVPVIRNADKTSLADLTSRYTELVDLARRRRVTSEMTSGGIASVSNFGTFGLDWGTPIPLPDQTLLARTRRRKKSAHLERGETAVRADHASRAHAQLRSSQSRRRRRRASLTADRRTARRTRQTVARASAAPRCLRRSPRTSADAAASDSFATQQPCAALSRLQCSADEFHRDNRSQHHHARAPGAISRGAARAFPPLSYRRLQQLRVQPGRNAGRRLRAQ